MKEGKNLCGSCSFRDDCLDKYLLSMRYDTLYSRIKVFKCKKYTLKMFRELEFIEEILEIR
jgi:hypothetical protein